MLKKSSKGLLIPLAVMLAIAFATPVQAQSLKYLSNDAEVIVSVNLQQIWTSKLIKDYKGLFNQLQGLFNAQLAKNEEVERFQKALGIDLFKDVSNITIGMNEMGQKPKNVLVVLEGSFNTEKFDNTAKKAAKDYGEVIRTTTIGNNTVYQITPPNDETFFLAMVNKNALVIAKTKEAMTTAINQAQPNLKQELNALLKTVDLKQSFNFVATADAMQKGLKDSNNPQAQMAIPFLKDLNGMTMSANLTSDLKFQLGVAAKDAATAKKLADDASQSFGLVKAMLGQKAQQNPQIQPALDIANTLKFSSDGSRMTVNGTISRDLIDDNIKKLENFLP